MSVILEAIEKAFSWLLPFLIGVAFAVPFWLFPSPIGRRKREQDLGELMALRKQVEQIPTLIKAAVVEGMKEYDDWRRKNPDQPMTEPIREQIAVSTAAVLGIRPPHTPGGPFYGPTDGSPPGMPPGGTLR